MCYAIYFVSYRHFLWLIKLVRSVFLDHTVLISTAAFRHYSIDHLLPYCDATYNVVLHNDTLFTVKVKIISPLCGIQ